jgi:hypothetical protein
MENEEWNTHLLYIYADMHKHLCNYLFLTRKVIKDQNLSDQEKITECDKALQIFQENQRAHAHKFYPNLLN